MCEFFKITYIEDRQSIHSLHYQSVYASTKTYQWVVVGFFVHNTGTQFLFEELYLYIYLFDYSCNIKYNKVH